MEKNIFTEIVGDLSLSEKHREEIKNKRGLPYEIIDSFKFRSAGPHVDVNKFQISSEEKKILSFDNILIPYFDHNENIIHLRPHKFGFPGHGHEVYIPIQLLKGLSTKHLVIAESEFKSIAACLLGVASIGIPGISSMSKKNIFKLVDVITALSPKLITIVFDNEIKNNPSTGNYKENFRRRYDTQIYAFIMGILIHKKTKIETRIATLDKKWMVEGKADIDGCLAQGMTPEEFQENLLSALHPYEYKNAWDMPKAHLSFAERKIDRFFYDGPLEEIQNCYYIKKKKENDGDPKQVKISNFIIKMIHTIVTSENISERYCRFVSNYGHSQPVFLKPEHMSSRTQFIKFCYENGDFEYVGSEADMRAIWHYIFINQDGLTVEQINYYGFNKEVDAWFFKNGAYYKGAWIPAEDNIVWINENGYKLKNDGEDSQKDALLAPYVFQEPIQFALNDVVYHIGEILGDGYAKIIVGWALGCYFMPEILKNYKIFPFIFLYGRMGSGKSTIANWISSFFGMALGEKGTPFGGTSAAALSRVTSYLSMMPVWLEEYRNNDKSVVDKNNFLRSIYDLSTVLKGSKDPHKLISYTARSTIILSGEEIPMDAALNSRCIMIPIFRKNKGKGPQDSYYWLEKNKGFFSYFGHEVITQKEKIWPKVKTNIDKYINEMKDGGNKEGSKDITDRTSFQVAIVCGIVDTLLGVTEQFSKFIEHIVREIDRNRNSEQALNVFFEDLLNLSKIEKVPPDVIRKVRIRMKGQVILVASFNLSLAHMIWEKEIGRNRATLPCSKKAILEHMVTESYFLKKARSSAGGSRTTTYFLDWILMPNVLKSLCDKIGKPSDGTEFSLVENLMDDEEDDD